MIDELGVRSVLDVGCGEGHAARFFRDAGCEVLAVDGSLQARRDSVVPESHVVHDFVDGPLVPAQTFDLVWSCEFVEHVEERSADHFLTTFAASRKYVFMTYAPPVSRVGTTSTAAARRIGSTRSPVSASASTPPSPREPGVWPAAATSAAAGWHSFADTMSMEW